MELYTKGCKVPKLGSLQDRMARSFILTNNAREVSATKLIAQIAVGVGDGNKEWTNNITAIWSDYLRKTYYMESEYAKESDDMGNNYGKWARAKLQLARGSDGRLKLIGLETVK